MKKLVLLFCLFLVFVACSGKDKTIEKIIYGDNSSTILDKQDFDKVSVSKSFNNFEDFANYSKQCLNDKINLAGKKFKVKGNYSIYSEDFHSIDSKHYYFVQANIHSETNIAELHIRFINTNPDVNPPTQAEREFTFIVSEFRGYDSAFIMSYSYDI